MKVEKLKLSEQSEVKVNLHLDNFMGRSTTVVLAENATTGTHLDIQSAFIIYIESYTSIFFSRKGGFKVSPTTCIVSQLDVVGATLLWMRCGLLSLRYDYSTSPASLTRVSCLHAREIVTQTPNWQLNTVACTHDGWSGLTWRPQRETSEEDRAISSRVKQVLDELEINELPLKLCARTKSSNPYIHVYGLCSLLVWYELRGSYGCGRSLCLTLCPALEPLLCGVITHIELPPPVPSPALSSRAPSKSNWLRSLFITVSSSRWLDFGLCQAGAALGASWAMVCGLVLAGFPTAALSALASWGVVAVCDLLLAGFPMAAASALGGFCVARCRLARPSGVASSIVLFQS